MVLQLKHFLWMALLAALPVRAQITAPAVVSAAAGASCLGANSVGVINGVSYTNCYAGSEFGARVNAAMADAENLTNGNTTGHVASEFEPQVLTQTTQITAGDGTHTVYWTLGAGMYDSVTLTGGTGDAVLQNQQASITCLGSSVAKGCRFTSFSASGGMNALYSTNGPGYYALRGVEFLNSGSTLASGHVCIINGGYDGSIWNDSNCTDSPASNPSDGATTTITHICCHANITNFTSDSEWGATAIDLEGSSGSSFGAANFHNLTANTHGPTATGNPNFLCHDSSPGQYSKASFSGVFYMEGQSAASQTAAWAQINGCQSLDFSGASVEAHSESTSTTGQIFDISTAFETTLNLGNVSTSGSGWSLPATIVEQHNTTGDCGSPPCNVAVTDSAGNSPGYISRTMQFDNVAIAGQRPVTSINLTSTAATNTTAINNALALGGEVRIYGTPGSEYPINTPLVVYSHDKLWSQPGVIIQQAASQNHNVLTNYSQTQAFTTGATITWTAGLTATLTSTGIGTAAPAGSWVYIEGSSYYLSSINYVSGLSGCTAGTQAVTFSSGYGQSATGTIVVSGSTPTVGAVTMTNNGYNFIAAPTTGTVATCTGTAVFNSGVIASTDTAYSGVFQVQSVTDANDVVIVLRRLPAAAATGPIEWKLADTDIQVENLSEDYNSASNTSPTGYAGSAVLFNGVQGMRVINTNSIGIGAQGYNMLFGGVRDVYMQGFRTSLISTKDAIKVYGPAFDSTFSDIDANVQDDTISFQPMDTGTYYVEQPGGTGGGDTINLLATNVHGTTAGSCFVLYPDSIHTMDDVVGDRLACHTVSTVTMVRTQYSNAMSSGFIKNMSLSSVSCQDDIASGGCLLLCCSTIDRANLIGVTGPASPSVNTSALIATASTVTVHELNIQGFRFYPTSSSQNGILLQGTVDNANVWDYYAVGSSSGKGNMLDIASTSVGNVNMYHGRSVNLGNTIIATGTSTGAVLNVYDNYASPGSSGEFAAMQYAAILHVANNTVASGKFILVQNGNTYNITSGGGNSAPTANYVYNNGGSPVANIYGGCSDIAVDISATVIGKAAGTCVFNTNTSYGPAAPVTSDGTYWRPIAGGFHATTASIGGSALTAGCTTQSTLTVNGAQTGMSCSMAGTAGTPANIIPQCSVTAVNTVTPALCVAAAVTPTAQTYQVTVN
jgi:hypothetical protein